MIPRARIKIPSLRIKNARLGFENTDNRPKPKDDEED
jgi:hypothetical protein